MALTNVEKMLKIAGGIISPFNLFAVKQNSCKVLMRFGKIDRICQPGLRWAPAFCTYYNLFMGVSTHKFSNLHIIDKSGTPIVVTAIINYSISNPEKYVINANHSNDVVFNVTEGCIRDGCSTRQLVSDTEEDIRNNSDKVSDQITSQLNTKISMFGITVGSLKITEANYAPEIMQQMLMKQQAQAYIDARKNIVKGSIGIINDTVKMMPELSSETKERIVTNLLTTLTSNSNVQPVVQLK